MKSPPLRRLSTLSALFMLGAACTREEGKQQPPQPAVTEQIQKAKSVIMFAAASTVDVISEAAKRFEADTGIRVACSFDSSSTLAKQITAGAAADIFLSADHAWMDSVQESGVIDQATRTDLLTNQLVLVAPTDSPFQLAITSGADAAPSAAIIGRLAVGDPGHVPAGKYAKQALDHLDWWTTLEVRLVTAPDVRSALRLVELGEVDAGIVYATDARVTEKVQVAATFPADSHDPITYPIALTISASSEAADFLAFLQSDEMRTVFESAGFSVHESTGDHP